MQKYWRLPGATAASSLHDHSTMPRHFEEFIRGNAESGTHHRQEEGLMVERMWTQVARCSATCARSRAFLKGFSATRLIGNSSGSSGTTAGNHGRGR